jgi:hypothetical protein
MQVVVLHLYSAFVLRSRSGFWALITGAEQYNEPVFAHHKYVFVGVVVLIFVGTVGGYVAANKNGILLLGIQYTRGGKKGHNNC